MDAALRELRPSNGPSHMVLHDLLRERRPVPLTKDPRATQMSVLAQRRRQPEGQRHVAQPSTLGGRDAGSFSMTMTRSAMSTVSSMLNPGSGGAPNRALFNTG